MYSTPIPVSRFFFSFSLFTLCPLSPLLFWSFSSLINKLHSTLNAIYFTVDLYVYLFTYMYYMIYYAFAVYIRWITVI